MAITTAAGLASGMLTPFNFLKTSVPLGNEAAGVPFSCFYAGHVPPAAAAPSPGLAGEALTSYNGQIPFGNPASGNTYLADFEAISFTGGAVNGLVLLADRLWHNSGIDETQTTAQTINSVAWPARDSNGSTNGEGVMVGLEVSTSTTNAGAITNTTMEYTNSAGTTTRTATITSFPATALLGTFIPFELQAGDKGIRSIQTLTLGTSYAGGDVHLVAYRILARIPLLTAAGWASADSAFRKRDGVQLGLPRLYDNTVPFFIGQVNGTPTGALQIMGSITYAQG